MEDVLSEAEKQELIELYQAYRWPSDETLNRKRDFDNALKAVIKKLLTHEKTKDLLSDYDEWKKYLIALLEEMSRQNRSRW